MSDVVNAAAAALPPPSAAVAFWNESSKGRKVGVAVILVLGLWYFCKYLCTTSSSSGTSPAKASSPASDSNAESAAAAGEAVETATTAAEVDQRERTPPASDREGSISSETAADLREAAQQYSPEYHERMLTMTTVPKPESNTRPFIGFSLADNIVEGALIVDGVFVGGPADQTGINIDHELLSINNIPATSIAVVRDLVAAHCHAGQVTRMQLRKENHGEPYEVRLWVMTADDKYKGKPYFFDVAAHHVRQSERQKQTWTPDS